MYDNTGNVVVFIMRRGRSKFVSGDLTGGIAEEIKEAFEGLLAYCGTYEIDEDKGTVTHYGQIGDVVDLFDLLIHPF